MRKIGFLNNKDALLYYVSPSPLVSVPKSQENLICLATSLSQAIEIGKRKSVTDEIWRYGFYVYSFSYTHNDKFSVKIFDKPDREWLKFVYRTRLEQKVPFDIVLCPATNDEMKKVLALYESEVLKCKDEHELRKLEDNLIKKLETDNERDQAVVMSQNAANTLKLISKFYYSGSDD